MSAQQAAVEVPFGEAIKTMSEVELIEMSTTICGLLDAVDARVRRGNFAKPVWAELMNTVFDQIEDELEERANVMDALRF